MAAQAYVSFVAFAITNRTVLVWLCRGLYLYPRNVWIRRRHNLLTVVI